VAYERAMETIFVLVAAACAIACLLLGVDIVEMRSRRIANFLLVASGTAAVAASVVVYATLWGGWR